MLAGVIIREYKLNSIGVGELSTSVSMFINFLYDNLNKLNRYNHQLYNNVDCFGVSDDKIVFEYLTDDYELSIHYSRILMPLRNKSLKWDECIKLLEWWIGEVLELGEIKNIVVLERSSNTKNLVLSDKNYLKINK